MAFEELLGHGEEHFPVRDDDREADRLYAGLPDPSRRFSAAWTRPSPVVAPGCDRDEGLPRGGGPASQVVGEARLGPYEQREADEKESQ